MTCNNIEYYTPSGSFFLMYRTWTPARYPDTDQPRVQDLGADASRRIAFIFGRREIRLRLRRGRLGVVIFQQTRQMEDVPADEANERILFCFENT